MRMTPAEMRRAADSIELLERHGFVVMLPNEPRIVVADTEFDGTLFDRIIEQIDEDDGHRRLVLVNGTKELAEQLAPHVRQVVTIHEGMCTYDEVANCRHVVATAPIEKYMEHLPPMDEDLAVWVGMKPVGDHAARNICV